MSLMKQMKQRAARSDERARQSRKRMRLGDEAEQAPGRAEPQRPMSLVFDELVVSNKQAVTSSLVSVARQCQRSKVQLDHYLARRCRVHLHEWQEQSLQFAARREQDPEQLGTGGLMLCHQQSLGKTLISLEHCLRDNQARARASGRRFNGAALVVCKDTLLLQSWMSEVASKWDGGAFFYYHLQTSGNNTQLDPLYLAHCCDLVFTTYSTVAHAYKYGQLQQQQQQDDGEADGDDEEATAQRRYNYTVLFGTRWRRIIADEGHLIVNASTRRYQAMMALSAELRWSVTATPSENSWHTICSSLQFIGVDTDGLLDADSDPQRPSDGEVQRLMALTDIVMLRKMKRDLNLADNSLVAFSGARKRIRVIEFESPLEKLIYYQYAAYAMREWAQREGERTNLAYVQQMMIQLCTSLSILPSLVLPRGMLTLLPLPLTHATELFRGRRATRDQTLEGFAAGLGGPVRLSYSSEARLSATEEYEVEYRRSLADPVVPYTEAPCCVGGADAVDDHVDWDPWVPSEHFDLAVREHRAQYKALYRQLAAHGDARGGDTRQQAMLEHLAMRTLPRGFCSTKNRHAIEYIEQAPADDKVIVFSNSIKALHELARDLSQRGIDTILVCGESPKENRARLAHFANEPQCKVLLLSLKLGSMGLNITCANHIIFLHPWWNPNALDHAEERIQRLGQTKQMFILHLIMNNTLELYVASLAYTKQSVNNGLLDERARKRQKHQQQGPEPPVILSHRFARYRVQKLIRREWARPVQ